MYHRSIERMSSDDNTPFKVESNYFKVAVSFHMNTNANTSEKKIVRTYFPTYVSF